MREITDGGVYKITCQVTGKLYVGSTVDFAIRWRAHTGALRRASHKNNYLQRAWDKYGADSFVFEILEQVKYREDLAKREQYWIDATNCLDHTRGYNLAPLARAACGRPKEWVVVSPGGRRYNVRNLREFCRAQALSFKALRRSTQLRRATRNGWLCFHAEDYSTAYAWACRQNKPRKPKHAHGDKHRAAKLTNEQARTIYLRRVRGCESALYLAREYNVSRRCVFNIADRVSWQKVTEDLVTSSS